MNISLYSIGKKSLNNYREGGVKKVVGLPYKKVRLGFIGCGSHASDNLYPSLRYAPIELVAVCARHKEKAERNAKWFGASEAYTDYSEMADKAKLDAVMVSVNAQMHHKIALEMMEKGIDVFVEKPPAPDAQSFLQMQRVSEKTGKLFFVGLNKRHLSTVIMMKRLMLENSFGNVVHFDMKFCIGRLKKGVSFLHEIGIHYLDLALYLFGKPEKIMYQSSNIGKGDAFLLSMKFKNGVVGNMTLSCFQSWKGRTERIEITGEKRFMIMENTNKLTLYQGVSRTFGLPIELLFKQKPALVWEPNYSVSSKNNNSLVLNGYVHEIKRFADISIGKRKNEQNLSDIYSLMRILDIMAKEREGIIKEI